ncbi:hypothetical protein ASPSYDRAFT_141580 [Aspergillus sydowii CBS 593.65]|uniref:Mitochondrial import inner membrane translocase subunit TIM44 n=1 Tax=Aspergillus sydowii CBS 593.65 TaxID=1036612 RepID=A0A1L9TVD1_9EURO|nr:uncharacterized protein ASPSYDRAFT_141580 [Aspergillus sydowii CBS 593.65]OJJ63382.1 hypothetical protein ASPSYDRAFT_141580 [Aspergillus sydowii CBS 593.65]
MIAANRMSATVRVAALRSPTSALRTTAANAIAIQRPLIQSPLYAISRSTDSANPPVSRLLSPYASLHLTRSFHVGTPRLQQKQEQQGEKKSEETKEEKKDESKDEEKSEEKKEDAPPPPPHGDKSPWQVFRDTLQSEFKASKEWNESTKALASSAHQFSESENVKRARAAYEAASGAASTRTSTALKGTGRVIGKSASWTWNTPVVKGLRKGVNVTASGLDKATRPVRETEAYKTAVGGVKQAIDDGSSSRYGGWVEKEERRRQRQQREEMEAKSGRRKSGPMVEDPNAGTNVTLHKDSAWKESWRDFKDSNPMMQKLFTLKETYNESENPLISTARSISDRVAGFFAENETAQVVKKFREMDPTFQMESFLREMREYILPEVLDAYVKGDVETLKLWLSDAQFSVYAALSKQITTAGLKSDGRILDIRGVDVMSARMLDPGDIPVFVVMCRTQEVHVYRNTKTNELAAGMEDKVQLVSYVMGLTRIPEDVNNPETKGWRLIELQKAARDYI